MKLVRAVRFVLALGICGSMAGLAVAGPPKPLKRPPTQDRTADFVKFLEKSPEGGSRPPTVPAEDVSLPPATVQTVPLPTGDDPLVPMLPYTPIQAGDLQTINRRLDELRKKRVELANEFKALTEMRDEALRKPAEPLAPLPSAGAPRRDLIVEPVGENGPPLPPSVNPFDLNVGPPGVDAKPAPSKAEIDADFEALMKKYLEWKRAETESPKSTEPDEAAEAKALEKEVERLLPSEASLKPLPLTPIPDNPPPHEGAMISLPIVIEPPDLLLIEVLEALPGRPISGERLVRPDGKISLGFYGEFDVRGLTLDQAKEKVILLLRKHIADPVLGLAGVDVQTGKPYAIAPRDSTRVFVDVTNYNSAHYYVQGDVAASGKMPFTGKDCVLDAINYAGGLLPTAEAKAIQLFRPARGGKPPRTYAVDLDAINKGDTKANYQLFPGDRLDIGRNRHVEATIEADRQSSKLHTLIQSGTQINTFLRSVEQATPGLSSAEREDFINMWLLLWEKSLRAEGVKNPDLATLRDLISLPMRVKKPAKTEEPAKK
jgi:polysaccharide biosynthesis/export protein